MAADAITGSTRSGENQTGCASTRVRRPSVKNPTARWAIGEILTMTGVLAPEVDGELTSTILALALLSRLEPGPLRGNLTFDLYGGYRRLLCRPRDCS